MDEEVVQAIGTPPEGRGLLGLLIEEPGPVRLREISEDPHSVGFPRGHPRMSSFLGVPIRIGGHLFGNLYLTDKAGGTEFSERDERAVIALATAGGLAIESALAYEEARRRESWLEATVEITSALASQVSGQESLTLIVERARGVAVADVAWIVAGSEGDLSVGAVAGAPIAPEDLQRASREHAFAQNVLRTGETVVVPDLAEDGWSTILDRIPGWPTLGPALMLPLRAQGRILGTLGLGWLPGHEDRFDEVDRDLSASFAQNAALALELQRSRESEQRLTLLQDRDRISHELHDVVIQRLFGTGMSLQGVRHLSDEPVVMERLDGAVEELDATIKDLRRAIFSLGAENGSTDLHGELSHMVARAGGT